MKLFHASLQRGKDDSLYVRIGEDVLSCGTLRHDNHKRHGVLSLADGVRKSNIGLKQAIVPPLTISVKKDENGPLLLLIPVGRKKNLVAVNLAVHQDGAIKEPGLVPTSRSRYGEKAKQEKRTEH